MNSRRFMPDMVSPARAWVSRTLSLARGNPQVFWAILKPAGTRLVHLWDGAAHFLREAQRHAAKTVAHGSTRKYRSREDSTTRASPMTPSRRIASRITGLFASLPALRRSWPGHRLREAADK
jgi:hypothetical protein